MCGVRIFYGTCRNTLLLLSAGSLSLQVDDDTLCNLGVPAHQTPGLALTADNVPNTYHLFPSLDAALHTTQPYSGSLFSTHSQLLGRPLVDVIGDTLATGLTPHVLTTTSELGRVLASPAARMATTFLGTAGDSGMNSYPYRLFHKIGSRDQFLSSEDVFRQLMTTRWVVKNVSQPTISNGIDCMTINIGLDTREVLSSVHAGYAQ